MAVIPFETLRTKARQSRATCGISMSVAFTSSTARTRRTNREFSAWTGKLNASRIPGDASFGKATFK